MNTGTGVQSVESYCNLLSRSRLLKPAQVQEVHKEWRRREARASAGEVPRFSQWLSSNHYLTGYQARQLAVGRADHFFLGHYKILDLIGQGRMAGIFKALHSLGQIVAVKMLSEANQDRKVLGRFKREARMAIRLKHPNVVRTYHFGDAGSRFYLVMDYLEGETLEEVLKRRRKLPCAEAVRLVHQALTALQHIHENKLVHRDLKPANMMLVPPRPPGAPDDTLHSTLKVLDLGVGRILVDEGGESGSSDLTSADTRLGTADYSSPEQARRPHDVDVRSDVYSLGCMLYHALTGAPPFTGNSLDVSTRHCIEPPRPIRQIDPSFPQGLESVLGMMLAKDPNQRFATPRHVADALQPFLGIPWAHLEEPSALTRSYLQWLEGQPPEDVGQAAPTAERWYYSRDDLTVGPVPTSQLSQLAAAGKLRPNDLLWMEGDRPEVAIPAKAALDFAVLSGQVGRPANVSKTPSKLEMGFDPDTGQVLDATQFSRWQREQNEKRKQEVVVAGSPSAQEAYLKAVTQLNRWLDLDRNRRPLMTGDMEYVRQHPDIQRLMGHLAPHGPDVLHRLWHHLQFMAENRRKYYCALG